MVNPSLNELWYGLVLFAALAFSANLVAIVKRSSMPWSIPAVSMLLILFSPYMSIFFGVIAHGWHLILSRRKLRGSSAAA